MLEIKTPIFLKGDLVRHIKSGNDYTILLTPETTKIEADATPAYAYSDGKTTWVRPQSEMEDGRFVLAKDQGNDDTKTLEMPFPSNRGITFHDTSQHVFGHGHGGDPMIVKPSAAFVAEAKEALLDRLVFNFRWPIGIGKDYGTNFKTLVLTYWKPDIEAKELHEILASKVPMPLLRFVYNDLTFLVDELRKIK